MIFKTAIYPLLSHHYSYSSYVRTHLIAHIRAFCKTLQMQLHKENR